MKVYLELNVGDTTQEDGADTVYKNNITLCKLQIELNV